MKTDDKLALLTDAAKYDVACTSSGVDRDAKMGRLGSTTCAGICHSFAADGRCITLLKVLFTNYCIYDCAYCANRHSNDIPRAAFTPRELADLTIEFYRRNFIEGLFVSSGVIKNPDYTMELLCSCVRILRDEYGFNGYIHAKAIPGASQELIDKLGLLVDRMSVNIELPSQDSLRVLAPDKSKASVMSPMGLVAQGIRQNKEERRLARYNKPAAFVPAGQSTQLIVGATPESDYQILRLSSALYKTYELKRVFFSAYLPVNQNALLPDASVDIPLNREHRLYQADWLMRFYQFNAEEIISEDTPFLDPLLDPKANWALNHLDSFPLEVNTAPYEMLLRIPGLGVTGAQKIVKARRYHLLQPENLKKLGLSLKRMQYFITCGGKYVSPLPLDHDAIYRVLASEANPSGKQRRSGGKNKMEGQISLFETLETQAALPGNLPQISGGYGLQVGHIRAFKAQREKLAKLQLKEKCAS